MYAACRCGNGSSEMQGHCHLKPESIACRLVFDQRVAEILEDRYAMPCMNPHFGADGEVAALVAAAEDGSILLVIRGLLIEVAIHTHRHVARHLLHGHVLPRELVAAAIVRSGIVEVHDVLVLGADFPLSAMRKIGEGSHRGCGVVILPVFRAAPFVYGDPGR